MNIARIVAHCDTTTKTVGGFSPRCRCRHLFNFIGCQLVCTIFNARHRIRQLGQCATGTGVSVSDVFGICANLFPRCFYIGNYTTVWIIDARWIVAFFIRKWVEIIRATFGTNPTDLCAVCIIARECKFRTRRRWGIICHFCVVVVVVCERVGRCQCFNLLLDFLLNRFWRRFWCWFGRLFNFRRNRR